MPRKETLRPDGPLEKYRTKRSADTTPEPFGSEVTLKEHARGPRLFVVQKHAARNLHYDFRLELDGVLKSWAVPKGPSPDPADRRLAMEVEDHPVEYADFEGIIPKGNYGAGPVIVWDRGSWNPVEDPGDYRQTGKLTFELFGYKLRGVWHLFRAKGSGKEWFLTKRRGDAFCGPAGQKLLSERSIFSGLTLEELGEGSSREPEIRRRLVALGAPARPVSPAGVSPMLAQARPKPFSEPGWLYELKYDGFRVIASKEAGGGTHLWFRRGSDATAAFPEIARSVGALPFSQLVLDGEVCVLDERSRPSFQRLQKRALLRRATDIKRADVELPAVYFVFDLLGLSGFDLRPLPLKERKAILRQVLPSSGPLRFADHIEESGTRFFEEVERLGLEGMMAKRADSPYRAGRSPSWVKVRSQRTGDFAVVGYTPPEGSRTGLGALHLATFDGRGFVYAGRVGSGFTERELNDLPKTLDAIVRKGPPCRGPVPKGRAQRWVEPRLVVEVRFLEWTTDGVLRQPVFLRLRDDKPPEECVREESGGSESKDDGESPEAAVPTATESPVPVERAVTFTNLKKVFWPEKGHTKGDLIEYYRSVAPVLLPYLADRPLVLTRFPDGIHGKSFFQKDAPAFVPAWVRTEKMWSEHAEREISSFVCENLETLLLLANLGTIPLHIWASRIATLQQPDWCLLDLDPKGAPFADVVAVALAIRKICESIEIPSFVKTSGATGLHVLLPLGRECTYQACKTLGELLARVVASELPAIATVSRVIADRGGRVYIDFLQNGHGKLMAGPYCARPVPAATVSTPLRWSEVTKNLDISQFDLKRAPERFLRIEDPLRKVLDIRPGLPRVLERLDAELRRRSAQAPKTR